MIRQRRPFHHPLNNFNYNSTNNSRFTLTISCSSSSSSCNWKTPFQTIPIQSVWPKTHREARTRLRIPVRVMAASLQSLRSTFSSKWRRWRTKCNPCLSPSHYLRDKRRQVDPQSSRKGLALLLTTEQTLESEISQSKQEDDHSIDL